MSGKMIATLSVSVALFGAVLGVAASASGAPAKKKCSTFASQKAAQMYFVRKGGSESNDVGGLDPDGDGLVCPDNPGPFEAYVEIGFAKGFFYGELVCVNYPPHRSKGELKEEKAKEEKASKEKSSEGVAPPCDSTLIDMELKEVAPGPDPEVATNKAEAAPEPVTLPVGAPEKKVKGEILSFEWKLEPKKTKGIFYALSEDCYGTHSRHLDTGK